LVSNVEEGVARSTKVFWANLLKEVVDGYEQLTSIVHGVQKDGIQNGWDARTDRKGKGWRFKFELIEGSKNTFLCMTDAGTYGLTGDVLPEDEYADGLSKHQRWAAFEGYGFTKEDFEKNPSLGSRGRGKFIFVGASSINQILYDTLTVDGDYRFGSRIIDRTRNDIIHFDKDKGRKRLQEVTFGAISPLKHVGSRVIIAEPIPELVEAIKSGEFAFMIGETWWEIIKKNNARISIICDDEERVVEVPPDFDLLKKDEVKKKVWIKRGKKKFGDVTTEVRALHIVCQPGEKIREELRGISIQRGGMKICTEQRWSLPTHIRNSMYGYLSFCEDGERAIKEAEGVEHNTLKKRKAFVRDLRMWLSHEMTEFAKAKLGYEEHPEKERREKQKSAEKSALSAINQIANSMDLKRLGPATKEGSGTIRGSQKPIRLQIPLPEFPNPQSRRVDYKQSICNITINVVNDTEEDVEIKLKIYLRHGKEHFEDLSETTHLIPKKGQEVCFSLDDLKIEENRFPKKGQYVFAVRLTDIESATKLDQKGFTFFVETEPLARGIFETFKPFSFEEVGEYQYAIGYVNTSESDGLVLNYNVLHPGYLAVEEDKEVTTEYLFRFAAMELVRIDFGSPNQKIVHFDTNQQDDLDYALERYNLAMGKLFYYFYRSAT
jgi:hypothetical protein